MVTDPNRVKEIFLGAVEQPDEAARAAYLDRACGDDAGLRNRVEALLRSHDPAGSFLGTPAAVIPDPKRGDTIALDPTPGPGATRDGDGKARPAQDDEPDDLQFLSPSTRPDSLGRLGHYEVLQVLGRGGFGIVFRAFDDMLQRVVAVKVMAPQIASLSPARKRFLREARSSAAVRHENVVNIHEVGEQPLPHLVMEFIPGETLQQRLDRCGPLDVPEVLRIGRQIAEGLAAAHACDLIHRDIKPGNILLEGGSHKAKITDFGLARAADDASISQSGVVAGTPMFMSPEQALGHEIDQRADLFSLGSVLYQMASGRPPFRAPSALAVLKRVAEEPPRPIPEIIPETPDWLCGIIAKLHAKNPDERFQSAREVADLLADCEAKLKAKQEVKNVLSVPTGKPAAPTASAGWKWGLLAACIIAVVFAIWLEYPVLYLINRSHLRFEVPDALDYVTVLRNDPTLRRIDALETSWSRRYDFRTLGLPAGRYRLEAACAPGHEVAEWKLRGSDWTDRQEGQFCEVEVKRGWRVTVEIVTRVIPPPAKPQAKQRIAKQEPLPPTFKNSIGMEFVIVPKGKSWLGGGKDMLGDKEVEIPADFYLGKYEVTQEEWEKVMGENRSHFSRSGKGMDAVKDIPDEDLKRFPVEKVSWDQCQVFVTKLNQREKVTGWVYRLPKELEWEYACRGGPMADTVASAFDFYFAKPTNTLLPEQANFNKGLNRTCKVGSYEPNTLGLHDMHGNVWQWCDDAFADNGPLQQVVRGGAWYGAFGDLRAARRLSYAPSTRWNAIGFRLARVPSGAPSPEAKTPSDPKPTVEVPPPAPTVHDSWLKAVQLLPLDQHVAALPAKLKEKLPEFDDAFLRAIPSMAADRQVIMAEAWLKERKLAIAGFDDAWLKAIPSMATDAQVILVTAWLKERNPAFDGEVTHKTEGGVLTSLEVPSPFVHDLTPLRVLTGLRSLTCLNPVGYDNRAESDAAVLRSLKKLESINGKSLAQFWKEIEARPAEFKQWLELVATLNANQKVAAVSAKFKERNPGFAGIVRQKVEDGVVTELTFKNVRDLSPLRALEGLKVLNSTAGPLSDLSPLKELPLTALDLGRTQVRDLSPLTGMQLTSLNLHATQVQNLEPLKGQPLTLLSLQFTKVQNLEPLTNMPLTRLHLNGCDQVRDLSPLKAMPLTILDLYACRQVRDLEVLKGMPLTWLHLGTCPEVRDLEVLKGMPLKRLLINNTGVTDLKPLQALPLEYIRLTPKNITQGLNVLRDMKSLKTMGVTENQDLPAAEFWDRYDKGEFKK